MIRKHGKIPKTFQQKYYCKFHLRRRIFFRMVLPKNNILHGIASNNWTDTYQQKFALWRQFVEDRLLYCSYCCTHGRRKMDAGRQRPPFDFKIWYFPINFFSEKRFSLSFELVKRNFTTVGPSLENCFWPPPGKIYYCPSRKKSFRRPWMYASGGSKGGHTEVFGAHFLTRKTRESLEMSPFW